MQLLFSYPQVCRLLVLLMLVEYLRIFQDQEPRMLISMAKKLHNKYQTQRQISGGGKFEPVSLKPTPAPTIAKKKPQTTHTTVAKTPQPKPQSQPQQPQHTRHTQPPPVQFPPTPLEPTNIPSKPKNVWTKAFGLYCSLY